MSDFREEFPDGDQEPVEAAEQQADLLRMQARESIEVAYEGSSLGSAAEPELTAQGPEGLLFTGDAIRSMTSDQIAAVGEFASHIFGVEMRPLHRIERELGGLAVAETGEEEQKPVLLSYDDFRDFAVNHGYSDRRGVISWNSTLFTSSPRDSSHDQFPKPRFVEGQHYREERVDLESIYERLVASKMVSTAWIKGTPAHVSFLAHMVNELVQPDEPLPASRNEWVERARDRRRNGG